MSILLTIIGICLGIYVGGYLLFLKPIINLILCFQASALTSTVITVNLLKMIFASVIGYFIFIIFYYLALSYNNWRN